MSAETIMVNETAETTMGKVTSVYGVKGWVKVFSYTQPKENLSKYKVWTITGNHGQRKVNVLQCKSHGNGLIAQIEGCSDRDQAKALTDSLIKVGVAELPDLKEGEYYWHQLEGLEVKTESGALLGKVHHLIETGSNDVFVVRKCPDSIDGRERLIPYLPDQVVKSVDLDEGSIVVNWDPEF